MTKKIDLTQGNIALELTKVSVPIMLTMLIQMGYNLTDMIWIGSIGSGAVAAVGTAGFFLWLGNAIMFTPKIGVEVCVAQSIGKRDDKGLLLYINNGILLAITLSLIYSIVIFLLAPRLMTFFQLGENVNNYNPTLNAIYYLRIVSTGMIFTFLNPTYSAIFNGMGNSKLPFYYNTVGLLLNVILDPLLIFGVWIFPELGVKGAGIATVISQLIVSTLFLFTINKSFAILQNNKKVFTLSKEYLLKIIKIGLPPSLQSGLFAIIAIILARIIVKWGPIPIAVQRIGSQIESLSWMTASGFSTALSAFVGQNFGACQYKRILQGYKTAIYIMGTIGVFVSLILIFFPEPLFKIFVRESEAVKEGVIYLVILGYSQLFMCLEITTAGAFNGLGKSVPPSLVGITFNALRIPSALILSYLIGLKGIWWSISGSSIFKGTLLVVWFLIYYKKQFSSKIIGECPEIS
jgi:putative MATE family efflux protein